jgi:hypothetical protein
VRHGQLELSRRAGRYLQRKEHFVDARPLGNDFFAQLARAIADGRLEPHGDLFTLGHRRVVHFDQDVGLIAFRESQRRFEVAE